MSIPRPRPQKRSRLAFGSSPRRCWSANEATPDRSRTIWYCLSREPTREVSAPLTMVSEAPEVARLQPVEGPRDRNHGAHQKNEERPSPPSQLAERIREALQPITNRLVT